MIGKQVKLTKKAAKWYLDNPNVFVSSAGIVDPVYDTVMQIALATLLGVDITGTIIRFGAGTSIFGVVFNSPFGKEFSYYKYPESITLVK